MARSPLPSQQKSKIEICNFFVKNGSCRFGFPRLILALAPGLSQIPDENLLAFGGIYR
jgi:hypothetical protein